MCIAYTNYGIQLIDNNKSLLTVHIEISLAKIIINIALLIGHATCVGKLHFQIWCVCPLVADDNKSIGAQEISEYILNLKKVSRITIHDVH